MKDPKPYSFIGLLYGVVLAAICVALLWLAVKSDIGKGAIVGCSLVQIGACIFIGFKYKIWKGMAIGFLLYALTAGLILEVPRLPIVNESIRNLYYHVPMWFGMIIMVTGSIVFSIKYLISGDLVHDRKATELARIATVYGVLGLLTGMVWANYTWGSPWSSDPKQLSALVGTLIYLAFLVVREAFDDDIQRARVSSVYSIFAYPLLIVLLFVLPRMMQDSLHPGNGGNPAFGEYDLNENMRIIFYPAILGWTLLGVWVADIRIRTKICEAKLYGID